jgi:thymidine kinase
MATLEVLVGPMFSGKTDELIRRARDAVQAGRHVVVLKPAIDTRHPPDRIVSHSGNSFAASSAASSADIIAAAAGAQAVFVDEVQFFDAGLVDAADLLRAQGVDVVGAGLDLDFRREPFPTTRALGEAAARVQRFEARCGRCGRAATVTQRLVGGRPAPLGDSVVRIGDEELYEPRCEQCWAEERESSELGAAERGAVRHAS